MYIFLLIIHVIVCLVLIFVVLLQAGRGGGFSEMVGGGQPQSIFGTQTNTFMTRATEVCAVLFIVTSLSLGILTSQKSKSLVEKELRFNPMRAMQKQIPPGPASTTKESSVPHEVSPEEAKRMMALTAPVAAQETPKAEAKPEEANQK